MSLFQIAKNVIQNFFSPPATRAYPNGPAKVFKDTRGHVENDMNKCILCGTCQRKCPCEAICVDPKAKTWEIDRSRCIACGCCVEVCPVKSLRMDNAYIMPSTSSEMKDLRQSTNANLPRPAPVKK